MCISIWLHGPSALLRGGASLISELEMQRGCPGLLRRDLSTFLKGWHNRHFVKSGTVQSSLHSLPGTQAPPTHSSQGPGPEVGPHGLGAEMPHNCMSATHTHVGHMQAPKGHHCPETLEHAWLFNTYTKSRPPSPTKGTAMRQHDLIIRVLDWEPGHRGPALPLIYYVTWGKSQLPWAPALISVQWRARFR